MPVEIPDTDDLTDEQVRMIETLLARFKPDAAVMFESHALRATPCRCDRPWVWPWGWSEPHCLKCGHGLHGQFEGDAAA